MKDIDFDELDRAVNSLMSPTDNASPTQQPAQEPAVAETSAQNPVNEPTIAPNTADTKPVAPSPRRGGRFMDMVHSSSDMKTKSSPSTSSREGITITPRPSASDKIEEPISTEVTEPETVPEESNANAVMPDPIDMAADQTESTQQPDSDNTASTVEDNDTVDLQNDNESPFLTDAKVEKRPLNSDPLASTALSDTLAQELEQENTTDEAAADDQPEVDTGADEPPQTPQVPELSSDLVAIESSDDTPTELEPIVQKDEEAVKTPSGPTSIQQQYTSLESTGDKSHAAIYDASQYPEPVAHPAKKKSGWTWVLWVILLLAIGAGGAVALYVMGIIP